MKNEGGSATRETGQVFDDPHTIVHPVWAQCPNCFGVTELCRLTSPTIGAVAALFQQCVDRCGFWQSVPTAWPPPAAAGRPSS